MNCIVKAVAGGLLNYHAPFTQISRTRQEMWGRHVRKVLREKTYARKDKIVAALYAPEGKGLGWFSTRS